MLDSHLRVRGVASLPIVTSGNTASSTLMIAEKAARWIRAAH